MVQPSSFPETGVYLEALDSSVQPQSYVLTEGQCNLGRDATCSIVITRTVV